MTRKNRNIILIILAIITIALILYLQLPGFDMGMNDGAQKKKEMESGTFKN